MAEEVSNGQKEENANGSSTNKQANNDKKVTKKDKKKKKEPFRETQRLPKDPVKRKELLKIRKIGNTIRAVMFGLNAGIWVFALLAIIGGLMVGLSNGTLSLDAEEDDSHDGGGIRWDDFLYTTPATILLYYGILMLIAAIFGCFASAGGRKGCTITYAVALFILLLFDFTCGIIIYWNPMALKNFLQQMNDSMNSYGKKDKRIGVIPILVEDYWDHLQRVGGCCGLLSYRDWKKKTIADEAHGFSIPDSCCTKAYDYRKCGWRIWKHKENDVPSHKVADMVKTLGCLNIFPENITAGYFEVAFTTILLGLSIVACFVLSIVMLVLIFVKKYRTTRGPQNIPHLINPEDPANQTETELPKEEGKITPGTDSGFEERETTPPYTGDRKKFPDQWNNPNFGKGEQSKAYISIAKPGMAWNSRNPGSTDSGNVQYNVYTFFQDQDKINRNFVDILQKSQSKHIHKFDVPADWRKRVMNNSKSKLVLGQAGDQPKSNSLVEIYVNRIGLKRSSLFTFGETETSREPQPTPSSTTIVSLQNETTHRNLNLRSRNNKVIPCGGSLWRPVVTPLKYSESEHK